MYRSIGVSGYKCLRVGRTGAISVSSPWSRPISAIRRIMRLLRLSPRHSGAIKICSAQSAVGSGVPSAKRASTTASRPRWAGSQPLRPTTREPHPPTDDFLALVIPGVELKLGVFGHHTAEEAFENWVVVQELGPDRPLREAGRVWEVAGPLGPRRKVERHVKGEPRTPDWTLPPAELCSGSSGDIPERWPTLDH